MATSQIQMKLEKLLKKYEHFDEECQVVYLMVSIRKILDNEEELSFPLLRFYCDWTVHTKKDHIIPEIKKISKEMYEEAKFEIENPVPIRQGSTMVARFIYMEHLKDEINKFFDKYLFAQPFSEKAWLDFIKLLVKVLESQPINNPVDQITSISFLPAMKNVAELVIKFKQPIDGKKYYSVKNLFW